MNNDMNPENYRTDSDAKPEPAVAPPAEMDPSKAIGMGMDVIQQVFAGLVQAVQKAVGPELLRDFSAGSYLDQVASCIEELAAASAASSACPPAKVGELTCLVERMSAEIKGSKFETQEAAFQQRLEAVAAAAKQPGAASAATLAEAGGYFRAAAKTAARTMNDGSNIKVTLAEPHTN